MIQATLKINSITKISTESIFKRFLHLNVQKEMCDNNGVAKEK
jgi:hypothetical protein